MNQLSKAAADSAGQDRMPAPKPVVLAARLMYSGAALTVVGLLISVIALLAGGPSALKSSYPRQTPAQLHSTETSLIVVAAFSGLIEVGIWILVARANQGGLRWARIAASVLFALSTWNLIAHLRGALTVANLLYTVLIWLVGLGAIALLWQKESNAFFAATPASPRRSAGAGRFAGPGRFAAPSKPANPGKSASPSKPAGLAKPASPGKPAGLAKPASPGKPAGLAKPPSTAKTATPGKPSGASKSAASGGSADSASTAGTAKPGRAGSNGRKGSTDRTGRTG